MAKTGKYEGLNREELVARLGSQCSPMPTKEGYVIGPDVNGRICHIATCDSKGAAQEYAEELNCR